MPDIRKPANKPRKPASNPLNTVALGVAAFLAFGIGAWYFAEPVAEETSPAPATEPAAERVPAKPVSHIPEVNPRLTWANFEKLRDGMTEQQLRTLFGEPTTIEIKQDDNGLEVGRVHCWSQSNPAAYVKVEFLQGRSISRKTNLSPPAMHVSTERSPYANVTADAYRKTREKFEQIQVGMSEADVTAILGAADNTHSRTTDAVTTTRTLTWRPLSRYVTITVTLRNDSVISRNWNQVRSK